MGSRLKDKVAIITGGGHGIGRAFALGLADEGAKVVAADIDAQSAQETVRLVQEKGGEAMACPVDVSVERSAMQMAREASQRFGGIDILINDAAVFHSVPIEKSGFMTIPMDQWDRLMAVNVRGVFLCIRAVYPYMKERGKGKIINISSGTVFHGTPYFCHYVTSKAAVIGMTRSLARELGDASIAINAIAPGATLSDPKPGTQAFAEKPEGLQSRCFKRIEVPQDLVGAAIFLASGDSDFMTGQTMVVDGGSNMH